MDEAARRALMAQYEAGYQAVGEALGRLAGEQMDARPAPDEWSPREIVHHLADSEMVAALWLRRLLAEERPALRGYDESEYAQRLHYDRPIEASLEALKAARRTTAELLQRLSEPEWARAGSLDDTDHFTVERWLEMYASHAQDHAGQILQAAPAAG